MIPFVLGIFGALVYFGGGEIRRFENIAARDIKSKLRGEHAQVKVKTQINGLIGAPLGDLNRVTITASNFETDGLPLFTQPELSKKGLVRDLRIELKEFTIGGLLIQDLNASIPNCHFDFARAISKHQIRLSQSGIGKGSVRIREHDLEAFILHKFREIKRVTVKLADDQVLVTGYGEFLIITTDFEVRAKLTPVDGTKLFLTDTAITFDGNPADAASSKVLLAILNPVVDLNKDLKLHDAIHIEKLSMQNGILEASGKTKIPDEPKPSLGVSELARAFRSAAAFICLR